MSFYNQNNSKTIQISSEVMQVMFEKRGWWQWCIPEDIVWLATGTRRRVSHLTSLQSLLLWWLVTHEKAFLTANITWRRVAGHSLDAIESFIPYLFSNSFIQLCRAYLHLHTVVGPFVRCYTTPWTAYRFYLPFHCPVTNRPQCYAHEPTRMHIHTT